MTQDERWIAQWQEIVDFYSLSALFALWAGYTTDAAKMCRVLLLP